MNLIDKDALIEALGIETDCYDCEHETIIYHCDLDPVTVCEKIMQAPVITVTTESAEKAIEVLKNAAWLGAVYSFEETEEAVKTAIRALQVTSAQPNVQDSVKDADCISRQQAIDALDCINGVEEVLRSLPTAQQEPEEFEWCRDCKEYDQTAHCCHRWTKVIQQTVAELKAEPKPGTWIYDGDCYKCNKCGATYSWWADSQTSNYCPNCGAMMKEGEEHEA